VFADAWLQGWLAEISADVWEALVHWKRFVMMRCTKHVYFAAEQQNLS